MNKVYLLLRDNKQTGPHTLEELVKTGIKPLDLIWVEGRSAAWAYASEIATLKPYIAEVTDSGLQAGSTSSQQTVHEPYRPPVIEISPTQKIAAPKKIYVSLPAKKASEAVTTATTPDPDAAMLEKKADELRKRALDYAKDTKPTPTPETVQTKYSRNVSELEEQYTSWMYKQKTQKKNRLSQKSFGVGVVALLLIAGAYVIVTYSFHTKQAKTELTAKDNSGSIQKPPVVQQATQQPAIQRATGLENESSSVPAADKKETFTSAPVLVKRKNSNTLGQQAAVKTPVLSTKRVEEQKVTAEPQGGNNKNEVAGQPKKDEHVITAPPQKAKTFGEKISGFFNKFKSKKQEEKPLDESQGKPLDESQRTTRDPTTSERKARHRGDEAPASAEAVNLADFIDITSNEPPDNWMLGIHGLKLTVHNKSDETIKTAVVEVRYYNEQKELLDKKILNFTNIPPGKSATSSAPDHRLAERTDYRLVSAGN